MQRRFPCEYISKVNEEHFLNADLGFQKWAVISVDELYFAVNTAHREPLKFGDKVWVEITMLSRHPYKYKGVVIPG